MYYNVSVPTITIYPANKKKATRQAVVVCPGGGYVCEAAEHEGSQICEWLAGEGITCILLKYRLPNGHAGIPLADAQRAITLAKRNASEWGGYDSTKVGICGFSAGGHLASTAGTHFTKETRPAFMILFYPVVTMNEKDTHMGSRINLLGKNPDDSMVEKYSNELHVSDDTPPAIFFLSDDDNAVPPANSINMYLALKKNHVPASLHIFPEGGHGWGYRMSFKYHEAWKTLLLQWLAGL
jgi:acetyl esterase/lipase